MNNDDKPIDFRELQRAVKDHGEALAMLTAFRHAANSLAVEAGVIAQHIEHDDAAKSVLQDVYFLQLIAEAELRLKRVTTGYERLRAASAKVAQAQGSLSATRDALAELVEVLADDLK